MMPGERLMSLIREHAGRSTWMMYDLKDMILTLHLIEASENLFELKIYDASNFWATKINSIETWTVSSLRYT